jgi:hypothetical protein
MYANSVHFCCPIFRSSEQHSDEHYESGSGDHFMHADTAINSHSNSDSGSARSPVFSTSVRTGVSKWIDAVKSK